MVCLYPKYHMVLVYFVTPVLCGIVFLLSSGQVQAGVYGWFTLVGLWHQVMHQQFSFNAVSSFLACTNLSVTDVHIQLLKERKQTQCCWVSLQIAFMSYITARTKFTLCLLYSCFRKQYAVDCHSQRFGFLEWVACATFLLTENC